MGTLLPFTNQDAHYDNAKFRKRSWLKVVTQTILTSNTRRSCGSCGTGKILLVLLLLGFTYLYMVEFRTLSPEDFKRLGVHNGLKSQDDGDGSSSTGGGRSSRFPLGFLKRKPPILAPQLDQTGKKSVSDIQSSNATKKFQVEGSKRLQLDPVSMSRQAAIVEAFRHAWEGYKTYAMGYDELQPLSKKGVDGLGGLGATVVDALDTAMIMDLGDVVKEAGSWVEHELPVRLKEQGQVNLFETTIRVLGGLLSAYHLSGGGTPTRGPVTWGAKGDAYLQGPKPNVYLERATDLADRLMSAFTSSPSAIPYSDVVLRDKIAHAASGDGASSTAEVATLQLEFGYLSQVSRDSKYSNAAMHVYEHLKTLPKVEGLVPIYISPQSGQFQGNNIRLGSRGDSYYEYLLKVWLQQGGADSDTGNVAYLREMYDGAMTGVKHRLVRKSSPNGLVFVGELPSGESGGFSPKMDHLVCFLAGNLALGATKGLTKQDAQEKKLLTERDLQDLQLAEDLGKTCYEMYAVTATGIAPEIVYFNIDGESRNSTSDEKDMDYKQDISIKPNDHHNLLRPETVESLFILYRITEDVKYREWGWNIFKAFEAHTKVSSGGYSSLDDVTVVPAPKRDKQETFFLGETLKYLYLLFAPTDVLPLTQFVFNTEAHPVPRKPQGGGSTG